MLMICSASPTLTTKQTFHDSTHPAFSTPGILCAQKKQTLHRYISFNLKDHDTLHSAQNRYMSLHSENYTRRRHLQVSAAIPDKDSSPKYFPKFVIEGSQVKVVKLKDYTMLGSGIMYRDIKVGKGRIEKKEQVSFHYDCYDRFCDLLDSKDFKGSLPGLTDIEPGFKEGIKGMKVGGRRMIIIPPLVSSLKQYLVFDVEFFSIKDRRGWRFW